MPNDDTLARAVGLASSKKGARLLIESRLAESLLEECPEWITIEGYVNNQDNHPYCKISYSDIRRRIAPTPELDTHELLYFWICSDKLEPHDFDYQIKVKKLNEIKEMLTESIAQHYKETIELLKRCNKRQKYTKEILLMGSSNI